MRNAAWWIRRRVDIVPRVGATGIFYLVRDRRINTKCLKMKEKSEMCCRATDVPRATIARARTRACAHSAQLSTALHILHTCG